MDPNNNLNKLGRIISSTIDGKEVSIIDTNFFATLKSKGWKEASVHVKPKQGFHWRANEEAASLEANMVLIPCYIEGRWILLARHATEKKNKSFVTVDIFDTSRDESLVKYFENLFKGKLPFEFCRRWRLHKDIKETEGIPDSESRVAGWMGSLSIDTAIRGEKKGKRHSMQSVSSYACGKEQELSNLSQERRTWLDDCAKEHVFFATKEVEMIFIKQKDKVNLENERNKAAMEKIDTIINRHPCSRVPFIMNEVSPRLFQVCFQNAMKQVLKTEEEELQKGETDVSSSSNAAKRKEKEKDENATSKKARVEQE